MSAVGGEGEFAELLRLVHDDLVDADLLDRHHVVAAILDRFQPVGEALAHRLDALARRAVVVVGPEFQRLVGVDLVRDHLPLEGGGHGDEPEGAVGDDDRVPARGCGAGQEAGALVLREVGLVGDQDAGGRVELQELARRLGEAVAGHDEHGLGDQAEPLLLHDGGGHREGFAGADGMGHVGAAGGDDAPDDALLVLVEPDDVAGTGQRQVAAAEMARHQVVETVIVQPGEPIGAIGVVQTHCENAVLILASFSFAASVASGLRTRRSLPSTISVSKICGVALFSASCSNAPAWRRGVPHSEVPAALPMKRLPSTDQDASSARVEDPGLRAHHLAGEGLDVRRSESKGRRGGR